MEKENQKPINTLLVFYQENLNQLRHVEIERMAFSALFAGAMIAALVLVNDLDAAVKGYLFILCAFFVASASFWYCAFKMCRRWNDVFFAHRKQAKRIQEEIVKLSEVAECGILLGSFGFLFPKDSDDNMPESSTPKTTAGRFIAFYYILLILIIISYAYILIKYLF